MPQLRLGVTELEEAGGSQIRAADIQEVKSTEVSDVTRTIIGYLPTVLEVQAPQPLKTGQEGEVSVNEAAGLFQRQIHQRLQHSQRRQRGFNLRVRLSDFQRQADYAGAATQVCGALILST